MDQVKLDDDERRPTCPTCGKTMHLDRVAASVLGSDNLATYTCPHCWGEAVILDDKESK